MGFMVVGVESMLTTLWVHSPALSSLQLQLAVAQSGPVQVGQYASGFKMIPLVIVLLIWTRLLTWVDKDTQIAFLPRIEMNSGLLGGMILALALFFFLPNFFIAFAAFLFIFAIEIGVYLTLRKQKVGLNDLKKEFKFWLANLGGKKNKDVAVSVGDVALFDKSGTGYATPDADKPERAGFDGLQAMLSDPLRKGADIIQLAMSETGGAVRYSVDGMPYDGAKMSRTNASGAVTLIKQLAALDPEERRKPQLGIIKASVDKQKKELSVMTRGSTAGEAATIEVDKKSRRTLTLVETGMTENQIKQVERVTAEPGGIILVAAPKANGLRTLMYALARKHDAFLQHLQTIEHAPDDELEGITQNKVPADASGADMLKTAGWVSSQEPDVVFVDHVDDPETAVELIKYAAKGKRLYIGVRAASTFDALTAWRKTVGDDRLAVKYLQLVIVEKLLRKLCVACKIEYAPDPETLRRLNMSPDKVGSLFQARSQPLRDQKGQAIPCDFCHDLHFKGRKGVFEFLGIDDDVRQIIEAGASPNQLKMQFKKQKQRYLQENAIAVAVAGETSLQEVARILKSGDDAGSKAKRSSSSARPTAPKSGAVKSGSRDKTRPETTQPDTTQREPTA